MQWTYAETNPLAGAGGDFFGTIDSLAKPLEQQGQTTPGQVISCDAPKNNYPIRPALISTDPPYYDNIGYADLSDFFYVWHRKTLRDVHPDAFRRLVTPKDNELVATPYRHGGTDGAEQFFMAGMRGALSAMRAASDDQPIIIYYAFKQAEASAGDLISPGWAAFLQAIVNADIQVDGTWPLRLEATNALKKDMNALASSVVLVCRKRPENAETVSSRRFRQELRAAMTKALLTDHADTIPLPDRRQAAIGPGIGVFSRYAGVRQADDSEMTVATALALINKEVDEILNEGTEALDRETRFALEWFQNWGYAERKGEAGQADAMLRGFDLDLGTMNRSGLFRAERGDAKLLDRDEMAAAFARRHGQSWRPRLDDTPTAWELAQHLARTLRAEDGGIEAAGRLLAEAREHGPDVLLIAERLYEMSERSKNAEEALVWNELQQAWPSIEAAAGKAEADGVGPAPVQAELV